MQRVLDLFQTTRLMLKEVIPCEHGSDTAGTDSFSVVWTLYRNAVTSVLASCNGTSHSHQPRAQGDKNYFSLMLDHLTAGVMENICVIFQHLSTQNSLWELCTSVSCCSFHFRGWGPIRTMHSQRVNQKSIKYWHQPSLCDWYSWGKRYIFYFCWLRGKKSCLCLFKE